MDQAVRAGAERTGVRDWTALQWLAVLSAVAAVLLLPAAYNGFPLIHPDTATYVRAAYQHEWPLDRSGFYGLFQKPFLLPLPALAGVWLFVTVQAIAVAGVLLLAFRRLLPDANAWPAVLLLGSVAAATALSWQASQLMPDAFTGPLVLCAWLAASRDLGRPGTPLLWLAASLLMLVHYTHLGIAAAAIAACLTVCAVNGTALREIAKRALAATFAIVAVCAAHAAVHGAYFGRWSVSPMGGLFLFARLNEDGLVPLWFDRHCGRDAPEALCGIRSEIPRDSQVLLWGQKASPFDRRINVQPGHPESWRWVDMMSQAAIGSIKDEPLLFAGDAAKASAEQFVHFEALDDECPERCHALVPLGGQESLREPLTNSRQLRGELAKPAMRAVTSAAAIGGLLLLVPLFMVAVRRRDALAQSLLATVAMCLLANAAMTGALSDVHDRYQSRVVWLAPFAALLLIVRWRSKHDRQSI